MKLSNQLTNRLIFAISLIVFTLTAISLTGWLNSGKEKPDSFTELFPVALSSNTQSGQVSFSFIENRGQWNSAAKFMARKGNVVAWFENNAIVLQQQFQEADRMKGGAVRLSFENASESAIVEGDQQQSTTFNYITGNDRNRWRNQVAGYDRLLYRGLYEGIDMRVREVGEYLEYDLLLTPGTNPKEIVVSSAGIEGLELEKDGSLVLHTTFGPIRQKAPLTWHEHPNGEKEIVECCFKLIDDQRYGFDVPDLNPALALVIDPGLEWSTYLGSAKDEYMTMNCIAVIEGDDVVVTGETPSPNFPTTMGAYDTTFNGGVDAFIARFNPNLMNSEQLVWCTFLGGQGDAGDRARAIIVDEAGNILTTGKTFSSDFPTTENAFCRENKGGGDSYVVVLDPSGKLLYSTLIGSSGYEHAFDIATDGAGNILITGYTRSADYPTTENAYDTTYNGDVDAFIARLDTSKTGSEQLTWATYFGGTADDGCARIEVDPSGAVIVSGWVESDDLPVTAGAFQESYQGGDAMGGDRFFAKFDPDLSHDAQLLYSSYLGGSAREGSNAMAIDDTGIITLVGWTESPDFPISPNAYDETFNGVTDVFVSQFDLNRTGNEQLIYSTYIGSSKLDDASAIVINDNGSVVICGFTDSPGFPTTDGAYDRQKNGSDAFVLRLNPALSDSAQLEYSTFLGGTSSDVGRCLALDNMGRAIVSGCTWSSDYPISSDAFDDTYNGDVDLFVARIDMTPITAVNGGNVNIPGEFTLYQNYPNPFNPSTTIRYSLSQKTHVNLSVYDALGRGVAVLLDQQQNAGQHSIVFDASDLASGVYFYKLQAGATEKSHKMLLLR